MIRRKAAHGRDAAQGATFTKLRAALLAWYRRGHRDLPWRRTRDPYAVWLSEIMLQQTRVQTVIPYYERFLAALPTVHALAEAPLDEVLRLWSGLGYYRRARMLHRGAEYVVRGHDGRVPAELDALLRVPGVGRYTAGAIASIAFGKPAPLVDGNVARVLARVMLLDEVVRAPSAQRKLWAWAEELAAGEDPGALNQALMELGATVCVPRAPDCSACPLRARCRARAEGRQEELPRVPARKAPRRVGRVAIVARVGGGLVLAKRRSEALFGGLWEPPLLEGALDAAVERLRIEPQGLEARGSLVHVLSHRRISVDVFCTRLPRTPRWEPFGDYERIAVVEERRLEDHALSALACRVLATAGVRRPDFRRL